MCCAYSSSANWRFVTALRCQMMVSIFIDRSIFKLQHVHGFLDRIYCILSRPQCGVNIIFICGKPKKFMWLSLYRNICFIAVVWNWTHTLSEVGLQICRKKPRLKTMSLDSWWSIAPAPGTRPHGVCYPICPWVPGDPHVPFQKTHLGFKRSFSPGQREHPCLLLIRLSLDSFKRFCVFQLTSLPCHSSFYEFADKFEVQGTWFLLLFNQDNIYLA